MNYPQQPGGFPPGGGYPPGPGGGGFPQQPGGFPPPGQQGFQVAGPQGGNDGTKKWLLIGCGILLLLIGGCALGGYFCYSAATQSKPHAEAFLSDLRAGNFPSALQRMDSGYQSTHTVATFQNAVTQLPALMNNTDSTFTNVQANNNTHSLNGTLTTPSGPASISMTLVEQGGHFYITQVIVNGRGLN